MHSTWHFAVAGLIGAVIALHVKDGCFQLPSWKDGKLYLNSLAGLGMGTVAGIIVDKSPLNAFFWGVASVTCTDILVATIAKNGVRLIHALFPQIPPEGGGK